MEITPTSAAAAATTKTQEPSGEAADAANELAGDFETFLSLLTAQLRNQDPLKPMESTEFVAQLASFSAVEQQVRTNDRLDELAKSLGGDAASGMASWIGRDVRAPAKGAFAGVPVDVEISPLADVDQAVLVVRNDFDQVVARRGVDPAQSTITWDGANEAGVQAAHGLYSFSVESYRDGEVVDTQRGNVFGTVEEVRIGENGDPTLLLQGGEAVAADEVTALR